MFVFEFLFFANAEPLFKGLEFSVTFFIGGVRGVNGSLFEMPEGKYDSQLNIA